MALYQEESQTPDFRRGCCLPAMQIISSGKEKIGGLCVSGSCPRPGKKKYIITLINCDFIFYLSPTLQQSGG